MWSVPATRTASVARSHSTTSPPLPVKHQKLASARWERGKTPATQAAPRGPGGIVDSAVTPPKVGKGQKKVIKSGRSSTAEKTPIIPAGQEGHASPIIAAQEAAASPIVAAQEDPASPIVTAQEDPASHSPAAQEGPASHSPAAQEGPAATAQLPRRAPPATAQLPRRAPPATAQLPNEGPPAPAQLGNDGPPSQALLHRARTAEQGKDRQVKHR
ncbi:hypothetical protein NDU88_009371 [Pleurodeles waltl]|uniref:Skin secretory protein xP2-like n=1 Tax=Pleurodeles waltl TaxID=8319 RepID=A0AAV7RXF5_PLEWA|nr:hypothetical protein NDU88_009371 [Pleurodeles waltl]